MPIVVESAPTQGPFPHGETVTVVRAGTVTDPYSGETMPDWDAATSFDLTGCGVGAGGSLEPLQDARNSVESDFDVIAAYGADVRSTDRLVIRGEVCEVVGRPFDWRHPNTGWEPGKVVQAKLVTG